MRRTDRVLASSVRRPTRTKRQPGYRSKHGTLTLQRPVGRFFFAYMPARLPRSRSLPRRGAKSQLGGRTFSFMTPAAYLSALSQQP